VFEDVADKLEPRLLRVLEKVESSGDPSQTVPVLIDHIEEVRVDPDAKPSERIRQLETAVPQLQEGIVGELHSSGVPDDAIDQLVLANAVATQLTLDQVLRIARRPDVRLIRYSGEEFVAL
jgi:hypothetical protein